MPGGLNARLCHAFLVSSELSGSECTEKRPNSLSLQPVSTNQDQSCASSFVDDVMFS